MDRSVRFWDVDSQLACGIPLRHEGEVTVVLCTPDGRRLLTAAFDKTMRLWNLPPPPIRDPKHPDRLRLSVEVRTGCRVDEDGNVVRLKQAEWLERQERLFAMGGPCDAPTWEEYGAWQAQRRK
jgi:WD40 repeat protein